MLTQVCLYMYFKTITNYVQIYFATILDSNSLRPSIFQKETMPFQNVYKEFQ